MGYLDCVNIHHKILWNHHHHQVMAGLSSDSTDVNGHLDRFERHLLYYLLYLIKKVWTTPLDVRADLFSCYQDWTTSPTTTPLCGLGPITHLPTPIGNCDYYDYYSKLASAAPSLHFDNHRNHHALFRFGTSNPINPPNANVNCVKKMKEKDGQWNDVGCSKQLTFACSMDAVKSCS